MRVLAAMLGALVLCLGVNSFAGAATASNGMRLDYNGRCLDGDVSSGGGNGSKVQLWDCNGLENQHWFDLHDNTLRITVGLTRCLDADVSSGGGNGSRVQLWDCNGLSNQVWHWNSQTGSYYNGYNGRCLDADVSSGGGNGSKMQLWDCNGLKNQTWH
jgi:endo-1,4-beta-xylanase